MNPGPTTEKKAVLRLAGFYAPECGEDVSAPRGVAVEVELMNDCGERALIVVHALTANDAGYYAGMAAEYQTGDETWCMNEWRPC